MYQGHCADGSSVQKHSAGDAYPYVIGYTDGGGYYVLSPNGITTQTRQRTYTAALNVALVLKNERANLH